jgi:ankyrin repeat protein
MFDSVRGGRIAVVEALLFGGGNPNATFNGMTALCAAIRRDDMALITRLILSGADVDAPSVECKRTGIMSSPLHHAVETGSIEVTKYLLDQNANPNAISGAGISVLMKSKQCRHNSIACMLLQHRADPAIGNIITGEPAL